MGVVIYGSRAYGRVDEHGGEYAHTSFFHIDFVPLLPRGSFWVTQELGEQRLGFPIKLHLRSVVATYLRVWGVIGAAVAFVGVPGVLGLVLGGVLAALSAWSWTWRSLRGKRARLCSDFRAAAFDVRCPPEAMTEAYRDNLHQILRVRWGRDHAGRAPDEVAQQGSADASEAITAYGLLHLAAVERGRAGAAERAAAERLIDGAHEPRASDAGPYRGTEAAPAASLAAAVAERARAVTASRPARRFVRAKPRWRDRPRVQLAGLAFATLFAAGGASLVWESLGPVRTVTARELAAGHLSQRRVAVNADAITDPSWRFTVGSRTHRVVLGHLGKHVLPIVIDDDEVLSDRHVVGQLRFATNSVRSEPWRYDLQQDPALDAATFDYVLDRTRSGDERTSLAIGLGVVTAWVVGWVLWLRAWRRRRRGAG